MRSSIIAWADTLQLLKRRYRPFTRSEKFFQAWHWAHNRYSGVWNGWHRQLFSLSHAREHWHAEVSVGYVFFNFWRQNNIAFGSLWTSLCSTNSWTGWAIRKKYVTSIHSKLRGVSHIARDVLARACYLQDQPSWSLLHKGRTLLHLYLLKIRCLKLAAIEVSSFL